MKTMNVACFISGRPESLGPNGHRVPRESGLQGDLYDRFNDFSKEHPNWGRFLALPVATADVALQTLKTPLCAFEYLGVTIINLLGAAFFKECNLKDALGNAKFTLNCIAITPVSLLMTPIEIVFQTVSILIDPVRVRSINFQQPNFKAESNQ